MNRHVVVMRRLNSLRHIRKMWGPKAVEWYFWRYVYKPKPAVEPRRNEAS